MQVCQVGQLALHVVADGERSSRPNRRSGRVVSGPARLPDRPDAPLARALSELPQAARHALRRQLKERLHLRRSSGRVDDVVDLGPLGGYGRYFYVVTPAETAGTFRRDALERTWLRTLDQALAVELRALDAPLLGSLDGRFDDATQALADALTRHAATPTSLRDLRLRLPASVATAAARPEHWAGVRTRPPRSLTELRAVSSPTVRPHLAAADRPDETGVRACVAALQAGLAEREATFRERGEALDRERHLELLRELCTGHAQRALLLEGVERLRFFSGPDGWSHLPRATVDDWRVLYLLLGSGPFMAGEVSTAPAPSDLEAAATVAGGAAVGAAVGAALGKVLGNAAAAGKASSSAADPSTAGSGGPGTVAPGALVGAAVGAAVSGALAWFRSSNPAPVEDDWRPLSEGSAAETAPGLVQAELREGLSRIGVQSPPARLAALLVEELEPAVLRGLLGRLDAAGYRGSPAGLLLEHCVRVRPEELLAMVPEGRLEELAEEGRLPASASAIRALVTSLGYPDLSAPDGLDSWRRQLAELRARLERGEDAAALVARGGPLLERVARHLFAFHAPLLCSELGEAGGGPPQTLDGLLERTRRGLPDLKSRTRKAPGKFGERPSLGPLLHRLQLLDEIALCDREQSHRWQELFGERALLPGRQALMATLEARNSAVHDRPFDAARDSTAFFDGAQGWLRWLAEPPRLLPSVVVIARVDHTPSGAIRVEAIGEDGREETLQVDRTRQVGERVFMHAHNNPVRAYPLLVPLPPEPT